MLVTRKHARVDENDTYKKGEVLAKVGAGISRLLLAGLRIRATPELTADLYQQISKGQQQ